MRGWVRIFLLFFFSENFSFFYQYDRATAISPKKIDIHSFNCFKISGFNNIRIFALKFSHTFFLIFSFCLIDKLIQFFFWLCSVDTFICTPHVIFIGNFFNKKTQQAPYPVYLTHQNGTQFPSPSNYINYIVFYLSPFCIFIWYTFHFGWDEKKK